MAGNPVDPLVNSEELVAAVDLGSNSFRMLVAQAVNTPSGTQLRPIDTLRETVRLAAGLTENKLLGNDAYQRGLTAIRRFGERIRGFDPANVRAVATNTLRVAKNARQFVTDAEEALGFPIEVIAGVEEARLIYIGAAHARGAHNSIRSKLCATNDFQFASPSFSARQRFGIAAPAGACSHCQGCCAGWRLGRLVGRGALAPSVAAGGHCSD